jgi:hypothetical protein
MICRVPAKTIPFEIRKLLAAVAAEIVITPEPTLGVLG